MAQLNADAIETIMLHDEEEDEPPPTHAILSFTKFGSCKSMLFNIFFFVLAVLSFSGGYFKCAPITEHHHKDANEMPFSITFTLENITSRNKMVVLSSTVTRAGNSTAATSFSVSANVDMHRVSKSGQNSLASKSDITVSYTIPEAANTSNSCHLFTDPNVGYATVEYIVNYMSSTETIAGADLTVLYFDPLFTDTMVWVAACSLCAVIGVQLVYFISGSRMEDRGVLPIECGLMRVATLFFVFGCGICDIIETSDWMFPFLTIARVCAATLVWLQRFVLFSLAKSKDPSYKKMFSPAQAVLWAAAWIIEVICSLRDADHFINYPYGLDDPTMRLLRVLSILTCILWAVLTLWSTNIGVLLGTFCLQVFVFSLIAPLLTLVNGVSLTRTLFCVHSILFPALLNVFLHALTWPASATPTVYN